MASSTRKAISCILLLVSIVVSARSQSAPEKSPGATISGKVTIKGKGASGFALGLVRIEQSTQKNTRYRGYTDAEGNYRIINVTPGNYRLVVAAPGFAYTNRLENYKSLLISKDEMVENVDFAIIRGGVITGKVTDSEGRPAIEEPISILPVDKGLHSLPVFVRTDDRGIYRAFEVPPGSYRVSAGTDESRSLTGRYESTPGYRLTFHPSAADPAQATTIEVSEGSEATNVDITFGPTVAKYLVRGRIIDGETGQPLSNIPYAVQMFYGQHNSTSMSTGAVSNSEGEFKLENLGPGKYAVYVEPAPNTDWHADYLLFEVVDQNVTDLIIRTSKGGGVSGVVVLEDVEDKAVHASLNKALIYAHVAKRDAVRGATQSASINPDGSFRIAGLPAGVAHLGLGIGQPLEIIRVERDGAVYPASIEIKEGEQITGLRVFAVLGNAKIRGVLKLAAGTRPPNSRFYVWIRRVGETGMLRRSNQPVEVDTRGEFLAEGLVPGTYEVNANLIVPNDYAGKNPAASQQVIVASGAVVNITLTLQAPTGPNRP